MLCEKITLKIVGEKQQPGVKQIYKQNPQFTNDTYLSGDSIMNYLGKNRFDDVMTCRQYCLTSKMPPQYFHKLTTDSKQLSKESHFLHPVVAVKETHSQGGKQSYQRANVSFQYN